LSNRGCAVPTDHSKAIAVAEANAVEWERRAQILTEKGEHERAAHRMIRAAFYRRRIEVYRAK
jgi:hypothetical protein